MNRGQLQASADRIRRRARRAQARGDAGDAIKLHILASEAKTIREESDVRVR